MKTIFQVFKIIRTIFITLSLCFIIVETLFIKGVPFTWTVFGEYVEDKDCIGGKYYQVNDSLKIVIIGERPDYYEYRVFLFKDNEWIKTSAYGYVSQFKSKNEMTHFLRSCYNDYLNDCKRRPKQNNKPWLE